MAIATVLNSSGVRQSLSDIVSRITSQNTIFFNMIKKKSVSNVLNETQGDNFTEPNFGTLAEGADLASFENQTAGRAQFATRTQRFIASCNVSREKELVKTAGVPSEFIEQKMKAMEKVLFNAEATFLSDQESNGAESNRLARGAGRWIQNGAQADLPVPAAYRTPTGSIYSGALSSFTETSLKTIMQSIVEAGGAPNGKLTMLGGFGVCNAIDNIVTTAPVTSTATDTRRANIDASKKTLVNGVKFYDGPYGYLEIIRTTMAGRDGASNNLPSSTQVRNRAYIFDPSFWEIQVLQEMGFEELPDGAGGRRGFVDMHAGLLCLNPLGAGKVAAS